jgi:hypothetical protein
MKKRQPTIRACLGFAVLTFTVNVKIEEIKEVCINAVKQVKFGFNIA